MSNVLKMAAVGGAVSAETDANFKQTVLLLHGDGTNGAQNNTFLDSSTNNFTITRNPTNGPNAPTQGTFSPFSVGAGEWSNYFDGSGDYFTLPSNSSLSGSGAFTFEFFVYMTATQTTTRIINGGTGALSVALSSNGDLSTGAVNVADYFSVNVGSVLNKWVHIVVARNSSGSVRIWANGSSVTSGTNTYSYTSSSVIIGQSSQGNGPLAGYLSNLRLVDADVYGVGNTSITVPTSPLTAVSSTKLLTCQSNRFVDNSTNAFAITRNGDVRVTPFSPFAPSAAYDPAVNGGSGYFDGTGDYLSIADNAAFELGSSNFAIEAWVYPLALPGNNAIANVASQYITTGSRSFLFALYNNAGTMQLLFQPVSGSTDTAISQNFAFKIGEWAHIAAVRSGNNITLYGNGASLGTTAYSSTINNATGSYLVGARFNSSSVAELFFNGYIAGHRLIVGSDTAPSGIPTAPPTAITNTSLLCNFTNAGIFDNTGKNNLETVGNAQIDTTTKKYGTGSMEFDGNDYLDIPSNADLTLGTGDFTVECWLYWDSSKATIQLFIDWRPASTNGVYPALYVASNGAVVFYVSSADRITTSTISANTWTHVALVRLSGSTKIYINGTASGSTYSDTNNYLQGRVRIGDSGFSTVDGFGYKGFIDDLRITKGVARYTANFTAPTKAFPDQ